MCGIFGIIYGSEGPLGEVLTGAARRLVYRGYDSVGAATVSAAGDPLVQTIPLHQLHDQRVPPVEVLETLQDRDVRVVK